MVPVVHVVLQRAERRSISFPSLQGRKCEPALNTIISAVRKANNQSVTDTNRGKK